MIKAYTAAIRLYGVGIKLAQPFSAKASKWVEGRRRLFSNLEEAIADKDNWIWIHVASLGEFEQGRPLIELIRQRHPEAHILLTFYSPSGYQVRKEYRGAHYVSYMPLDTPENAIRFLDIVKPSLVIFVKYEIWLHHFREMADRNIPVLLISAQFRSNQLYFRKIGKMFLKVLEGLQQIFVVDLGSRDQLTSCKFENVVLGGDTRIDRVMQIAAHHRNFDYLKDVLQTDQILVAGSTWPDDIRHLLPLINNEGLKCVIAPHENDESKLLLLEKMIEVETVRLSRIAPSNPGNASVVIVDTMGDLADIYHVSSVAYVGGGFSSGIHNILEPVAYRLPVIIGPNHQRFSEALQLIELGVCIIVKSSGDIRVAIEGYNEESQQHHVSELAAKYLEQHAGATERIYEYIRRERLL